MDLTLQQLTIVVRVHEAGGFTAAAQTLHVTQSSLSRSVAEIERRVGTPLFTRTTRRLDATAAGLEFVATARRVLRTADAEFGRFAAYLAGTRGRVRVATLPSLAALLLPGLVAAFRRERSEVELRISDALADEVLERVRSGRADLAVTVVSGTEDPVHDLVVRPVAEDRFCALVPPDHRLARHSEVTWTELAQEPFIDFDETTSIRHHVDRALTVAEAVPERVVAARNIAAVSGLVAAGLGISAVPGLVVPLTAFAGLVAVPLTEPTALRRMALVRAPTTLSPTAEAFGELVTREGGRPDLPPHARWTS